MTITSSVARKLITLRSGLSWTCIKLVALLLGGELLLHKRSERHARELAMRETNQRLDEFLNIASHEIKTPLTSIKGYIQLSERRLKNGANTLYTETQPTQKVMSPQALPQGDAKAQTQSLAEAYTLLERTDQQINRLNRLVNQLLDIVQIQQGNMLELVMKPSDLAAVVRNVVREFSATLTTRTIKLEHPSEEAIYVLADEARISQVITHYLSNSVKYSATERAVQVSMRVDGQVAYVYVRDEGPGIPLSEQGLVWERLYRVPGIEVQSGSEVGLGCGLYISRAIIERHHGRVGLESAPGAGATFWFALPLVKTGKSANFNSAIMAP